MLWKRRLLSKVHMSGSPFSHCRPRSTAVAIFPSPRAIRAACTLKVGEAGRQARETHRHTDTQTDIHIQTDTLLCFIHPLFTAVTSITSLAALAFVPVFALPLVPSGESKHHVAHQQIFPLPSCAVRASYRSFHANQQSDLFQGAFSCLCVCVPVCVPMYLSVCMSVLDFSCTQSHHPFDVSPPSTTSPPPQILPTIRDSAKTLRHRGCRW